MAYAASWKGAAFMYESDATSFFLEKEQIEISRLTRRVAAVFALIGGTLAAIGMMRSTSWLRVADSSDDGLGYRSSMGPSGTWIEVIGGTAQNQGVSWSFTSCESKKHSDESLIMWLQYYGLCMNDANTHSAAILAVYRGWFGALGSIIAGTLGMTERCNVRYAVLALFSGCFGLLSSLICFLNWRYVTDLLFEQAFLFGPREPHEVEPQVLVARGPVRMTYGSGLYLVSLAFCIDAFSLISLLVVHQRNILAGANQVPKNESHTDSPSMSSNVPYDESGKGL